MTLDGLLTWAEELVTHDGFWAFVVAGLYFSGVVLVRWRLIQEPYRNYLRSQEHVIRAQVVSLGGERNETYPIESLLQQAARELAQPERLLWGRGKERAAGRLLMMAERLTLGLLSPEGVAAQALMINVQLSDLPQKAGPEVLSQQLTESLKRDDEDVPWPTNRIERVKALADQGLALLHDEWSGRSADLLAYHRKTFWLASAAVLVLISLAVFLGRAELLLAGALGALVSRLFGMVRTRNVPDDYPTLWTVLLLSPLVGALSAYGGLLLVTLLVELNVLGEAIGSIGWDSPRAGPTLGLAFLLGFSERLLDRLAARAEGPFTPTVGSSAGAVAVDDR